VAAHQPAISERYRVEDKTFNRPVQRRMSKPLGHRIGIYHTPNTFLEIWLVKWHHVKAVYIPSTAWANGKRYLLYKKKQILVIVTFVSVKPLLSYRKSSN